MKSVCLLLAGLFALVCSQAKESDPPHGKFLELHSCELYAGGCVVSSEATLGGRYMLRAWNFNGGTFAGTDFAGLNVAVLQSSTENLAEQRTTPNQAIVYLPENATAAQRDALLAWLRSPSINLDSHCELRRRVVPIQFTATDACYSLTAGASLSISTAPLESCNTGACGDALWYNPRSQSSVFTVAVDRASNVAEPLLKLTWRDSGRRCVFLGKFGQELSARPLFVSASELCGNSQLF
jgi:hypothetical protein